MARASVVPLFVMWSIFVVLPRIYASDYDNFEVAALYKLKENLQDPNNALQNWGETQADPCTWYHVECDDDNKVKGVYLGGYQLSGKLVPELGNLTNLQYLKIFNNTINGSIPKEIGKLSHLRNLALDMNKLTGHIPEELGNLHNLTTCLLNNNNLDGTVPTKLQRPDLELNVSNNPNLKYP